MSSHRNWFRMKSAACSIVTVGYPDVFGLFVSVLFL